MVNVLADLALESEAAMLDGAAHGPRLRRATTASSPSAAWRWRSRSTGSRKRGAPFAAEALECLGGNGYIEEAPLAAQFYRDIQINTVWEGSGNVVALDVLRAMAPQPRGAAGAAGRARARAPAPTRATTRTSSVLPTGRWRR